MRRALFVLATFAGGLACAQLQRTDHVVTPNRALLLREARLAIGQDVASYSISPSGRYIAVLRGVVSAAPGDLNDVLYSNATGRQIVVWDSQTGLTKEITLPKDAWRSSVWVDWFARSDRAVVRLPLRNIQTVIAVPETGRTAPVVVTRKDEFHLLDPARGTLQRVSATNPDAMEFARIEVSPVSDVAVKLAIKFGERGAQEIDLQALTPDGRWGARALLPTNLRYPGMTAWSPDGQTFQVLVEERSGSEPPVRRVVQFDPRTGSHSVVNAPVPQYEPAERQSDVVLVREVTQIEGPNGSATAETWRLNSTRPTERPSALVSVNASKATLAPGEKYVAYIADGALFTRQVMPLTLQEYSEAVLAALRTEAMNNAKQAALAAIMFSVDYDNKIPEGTDPMTDFYPYTKTYSVLEGFVLVFSGDMTAVSDPVNTILGYTDTPFGRAVAYVDGHVKWEDGKT